VQLQGRVAILFTNGLGRSRRLPVSDAAGKDEARVVERAELLQNKIDGIPFPLCGDLIKGVNDNERLITDERPWVRTVDHLPSRAQRQSRRLRKPLQELALPHPRLAENDEGLGSAQEIVVINLLTRGSGRVIPQPTLYVGHACLSVF
jgi:hypothetical protein